MLRAMSARKQVLVLLLIVVSSLLIGLGELDLAAIWPSVVALVLVFTTRQVLAGLFLGALVGAALLAEGRLWEVPLRLVEDHLFPHFASPWKTGAVIFTLLLGGFVHLLERGGVLQRFLIRLLHGRSPRKVEAGAAAFGLVCFFDGLANSLMVGRIFQPLAREAGIARVRLAYIVDTTSAAVACLAFISTWIAYQLAMIREGFLLAGREEEADPYHLFFASIPHNYYAWFALLLMGIAIYRQWNIGPMGRFSRETTGSASPGASLDPSPPVEGGGLWRAWVPVMTLLGIVFAGIYLDGNLRNSREPWPFSFEKMALSFSEANVPAILVAGSACAGFLAWLFFPRDRLHERESRGTIFLEGMLHLFNPVLILVMAWMLSSTLKDLGAAAYLGELLGERLAPTHLPLAVFVTGAAIAFTTGTSWGTMGLLMPLAIPLAFSVSPVAAGEAPALLPMVVGAVFSGAVFGDHCSPLSDTTIVSSMACDVDPLDHVRTQLPYAMGAAIASALIGFLGVALLGGGFIPALSASLCFVILAFLTHRITTRSND